MFLLLGNLPKIRRWNFEIDAQKTALPGYFLPKMATNDYYTRIFFAQVDIELIR